MIRSLVEAASWVLVVLGIGNTLPGEHVPLDSIAPREPPSEGVDPTLTHQRKGPQLRMGAVKVSGGVSTEVVRRIVRQNFGRFRLCYENGLKRQPGLRGHVAVRFLIEHDGSSSNARNEGSVLPDAEVIRCMVSATRWLSFPKPEGGTASVLLQVLLEPHP